MIEINGEKFSEQDLLLKVKDSLLNKMSEPLYFGNADLIKKCLLEIAEVVEARLAPELQDKKPNYSDGFRAQPDFGANSISESIESRAVRPFGRG